MQFPRRTIQCIELMAELLKECGWKRDVWDYRQESFATSNYLVDKSSHGSGYPVKTRPHVAGFLYRMGVVLIIFAAMPSMSLVEDMHEGAEQENQIG